MAPHVAGRAGFAGPACENCGRTGMDPAEGAVCPRCCGSGVDPARRAVLSPDGSYYLLEEEGEEEPGGATAGGHSPG